MRLAGKIAIVTGAGNGIGAAIARRFASSARGIIVSDIDTAAADRVRDEIAAKGGTALSIRADVTQEDEVRKLVEAAETEWGKVDLFCSNAGAIYNGDETAPDLIWHRAFQLNTMAHVFAARAVLPAMLARGDGYILSTASAAGLLTAPGAAPYAVSKHGAVAFAEWLAMTYGDRGIGVSVT
jgi:NAD(P)-dependent dehydrogenase (short-subunit alcohol dehydrogenase family)